MRTIILTAAKSFQVRKGRNQLTYPDNSVLIPSLCKRSGAEERKKPNILAEVLSSLQNLAGYSHSKTAGISRNAEQARA